MTAAEVLAELTSRGVAVRADGGLVRMRPADRLDAELLAQVRARKAELLAMLTPPAELIPFDAARRRLVAAGALRRRGDGRVNTPFGPGKLLQLFGWRPGVVRVALDANPQTVAELPAGTVDPVLDQPAYAPGLVPS